MSKRLTDSTKWRHPWFRKLPGKHKLAFIALLDLCDCAGVWRVDLEDLAYLMKEDGLEWDDFLTHMEGRIVLLDGGAKWQVRDYIAFQYGTLNPNGKNRVHFSVIKCLRSHGIDPSLYFSATLEATVDSTVGPTVKEKEKAKEKDSISPDPDPSSVFADAPKPVPLAAVPLGPHECRAPLIAAGAKFYGQEDAAGWLGVVRRCGGIDRVVSFMERMPAEDRADRVKVETFIQKTDRGRQKAVRLDNAGETARNSHAARTALENEIKANNAAAKEPLTRICDYLCDPETDQGIRDKAAADASVESALKLVRDGKASAIVLGNILRKFPELNAIAHPAERQPA